MPGRPCSICCSTELARIATAMIAAGETDTAIGKRLGVGRMSVHRHRTAHVLAPARALADAAGRGRELAEQREQALAAAEAGDPLAFVSLHEIVDDLKTVRDRLDRVSAQAEADGQKLAIASLAGQQIRNAELRGRLGAVGGLAPKAAGVGDTPGFTVVFQFSGGREERISATPIRQPPAIDSFAAPVEAEDAP